VGVITNKRQVTATAISEFRSLRFGYSSISPSLIFFAARERLTETLEYVAAMRSWLAVRTWLRPL
jgi:hypothetical protein